VCNWARRCYTKLGTLTEDRAFAHEPNDMTHMFEAMSMVVTRELDALKARE